jgi:hypothetical protein
MNDILRELCTSLNLRLQYNHNKETVLSSGAVGKSPIIRAHTMFKDCPREVAEAVIAYFIDFKSSKMYKKTILDYIKRNFSSSKFKIGTPSKRFLSLLLKKQNSKPSVTEASIVSIVQKKFNGTKVNIDPNSTITGDLSVEFEFNIR